MDIREEASKLVYSIAKDIRCEAVKDLTRYVENDLDGGGFYVVKNSEVRRYREGFLHAVYVLINEELRKEHSILEFFNLISAASILNVSIPQNRKRNLRIALVLWDDFDVWDNRKTRKAILMLQNLIDRDE